MDNYNLVSLLLMLISSFLLMNSSMAAYNYNIVNFGAKPDGRTDSTKAFLATWQSACRSTSSVSVTVPKGNFLLKPVEFRGPCRSRITFQIYGTIVAPDDYRGLGNSGYWILFVKVNRISINGGTLDARGASFWACRKSGKSCPVGARSMTFNWANDVVVSGLTSINSQATHVVINSCNNVIVRKVKLVAPDQSPNTDGLHVQASAGVTVSDSTFQTGDDCISPLVQELVTSTCLNLIVVQAMESAIPAIFSPIVKDSRCGIVEDATAVMAQVAGCEEAMRRVSGASVLADLLDLATGSSLRIKENIIGALPNVARCGGDEARSEVMATVTEEAMEGIVYVADNRSVKGMKIASDLLKLVVAGNGGDSRFRYLISEDSNSRSS